MSVPIIPLFAEKPSHPFVPLGRRPAGARSEGQGRPPAGASRAPFTGASTLAGWRRSGVGSAVGLAILLLASLDAALAQDAEVLRRLAELRYFTTVLAEGCKSDDTLAWRVADDYLRCIAVLLMGWAWARIAAAEGTDTPRWQGPLAALRERILPEIDWRLQLMKAQWAEQSLVHGAAAMAS